QAVQEPLARVCAPQRTAATVAPAAGLTVDLEPAVIRAVPAPNAHPRASEQIPTQVGSARTAPRQRPGPLATRPDPAPTVKQPAADRWGSTIMPSPVRARRAAAGLRARPVRAATRAPAGSRRAVADAGVRRAP